MPDLDFQIIGTDATSRSLTPLLQFKLQISNTPATETIHGVLLHTQIQIRSADRSYSAHEKDKLVELFGTPDRWGQTLRDRFWTHADVMVRAFTGKTDVLLPVPCTYDLNIATTKYFQALESGDVSLIFLFSGTIFYAAEDGRLQVQQISWNKECVCRMPVHLWRDLMDEHYPNTAWLYLHRDSFERLSAYKRRHGLATWEQAVDRLLPEVEGVPA